MRNKYRPDLAHDASECDANYIRLCRLMPLGMDKIEYGMNARGSRHVLLGIEVTERCRYTTMLTVHFSGFLSAWETPRIMRVRVYYDLSTAEVISCNQFPRFGATYEYPNAHMHMPNEKSQLNRHLGEILTYCLDHGHMLDRVYGDADLVLTR